MVYRGPFENVNIQENGRGRSRYVIARCLKGEQIVETCDIEGCGRLAVWMDLLGYLYCTECKEYNIEEGGMEEDDFEVWEGL